MEEILPDQNGLPPMKDSYSSNEKSIIVAEAAEAGTHVVAEAYQINWHKIAAWKKYNARNVKFDKKGKKPLFKKGLLILQLYAYNLIVRYMI